MNFVDVFIARPVGTALLTLGVAIAGILCFCLLPVTPLPQVDFPTIMVSASLPGASPENMAATVAAPLERTLGEIAGVNEMTSTSALGSTTIVLQFDLSRKIDGAANDVQAGINAALALLPAGLPINPSYRKVNPADAPIMLLSLTSNVLTQGELYDLASSRLGQRLSQVAGVGQVTVGGSALPAVRVRVNPRALSNLGLGIEDVRTAIATANVNTPKGALADSAHRWQIEANDQLNTARDYRPVIIRYLHGSPVRLGDVADVTDSVQDVRNAGFVKGETAVLLVLNRQPGANIIEVVERIRALVPVLRGMIPATAELSIVMDRTPTIRASLREVEISLVIATLLVVAVIYVFLRNGHAALIPTVGVTVSLLASFIVMYLAKFSLNTISLMALTVSTGFVVDDMVVVMENCARHVEAGMDAVEAARRGARDVSFTVISMSVSLVAVFLPILLMGGLIGRMLREFSVTLAAAILASLVVSLTTTPMMCARLLRPEYARTNHGWFLRLTEQIYDRSLAFYEESLDWALRHRRSVVVIFFATLAFNIYLYIHVPKSFMPEQDTGRLSGYFQADQGISFTATRDKLLEMLAIVNRDPAVETAMGVVGGQRAGGQVFVVLKPLAQRHMTANAVIARLRPQLAHIPGVILYLQPVQDIRFGGRSANALYQYTLQAPSVEELRTWAPKVLAMMQKLPSLVDANSDQQEHAVEVYLSVNRDMLARLGVVERDIDNALNDFFGQRLVSTIYAAQNQYRVVLEAGTDFTQSPESLQDLYVKTPTGLQVPLLQLSSSKMGATPLSVNHQGLLAATTLSFNLPPGVPMSQATLALEAGMAKLHMPTTVQGSFQGTAKVFQESLDSQVLLIIAALITVYVVLGMLYESYIHPLTILSTLPSAGVGAILALEFCRMDFSIIAMIGVVLLIGIVKKNAIMMIDFAQQSRRERSVTPEQAIREACVHRYRPILMTTVAALLGALPLAIGFGDGAELRQPLGVSIVGGLALSQLLTLYTTPVIYLYLDAFGRWLRERLTVVRLRSAPK